MTDLQNIRWNRIFIEATAIVGSILLAFAIDAWWEQKKEASRAEELLTALENEWINELGRIDERLSAYRNVRKSMIRIMDAHTDSNEMTADTAETLWESISNWSTYKPTAKTFYYRSPDGLVYRSLIDCRRAHYHNEALTQAAMHSALKLNFDSEEDGGDDDIFAEVANLLRD